MFYENAELSSPLLHLGFLAYKQDLSTRKIIPHIPVGHRMSLTYVVFSVCEPSHLWAEDTTLIEVTQVATTLPHQGFNVASRAGPPAFSGGQLEHP